VSAVFGIIRYGGAVADSEIQQISAAMASRAPDGFTCWEGQGIAMGYGHLDPGGQAGRNIALLERGQHVIAADLRLDEAPELGKRLGLAPATSQVELVLEAFRRWGKDCPRYLAGDFAFSIWDKKSRRLFCARDHLGARPLYFATAPRLIAFASAPEALITLAGVSSAPNAERVATILVPELVERETDRTWHRDVISVMAGESLTVDEQGGYRKSSYWKLTQPEPLRLASESDYVDALTEKLRASAQRRIGDDRAAMLLSGGLDSASIVAALPATGAADVTAFSLVSGDEGCIESQCIEALQQQAVFNGRAVSMNIDDPQLPAGLKELAWLAAHPVENSVLLQRVLARLAGQRHRVLLHGCAGDVVQTSPRNLPANLLKRGRLFQALKESRDISNNHTYYRGFGTARTLLVNSWQAFAPASLRLYRLRWRAGRRTKQLSRESFHRINPDFADRLMLRQRLTEQVNTNLVLRDPEPLDPQTMMDEIQSSNTGQDRVAGEASMVARDIWADRDLVEFYYALPLDIRTRHGWTKYLARKFCALSLPESVCWRKDKDHLGWRLTELLLLDTEQSPQARLGELRGVLEAYLSDTELNRLASLSRPETDDYDDLLDALTLGYWLQDTD